MGVAAVTKEEASARLAQQGQIQTVRALTAEEWAEAGTLYAGVGDDERARQARPGAVRHLGAPNAAAVRPPARDASSPWCC